jgi:hypothetical protein
LHTSARSLRAQALQIDFTARRAAELTTFEPFARKVLAFTRTTDPKTWFFALLPRTLHSVKAVLDRPFSADPLETPCALDCNLIGMLFALLPNHVIAALILEQRNLWKSPRVW